MTNLLGCVHHEVEMFKLKYIVLSESACSHIKAKRLKTHSK